MSEIGNRVFNNTLVYGESVRVDEAKPDDSMVREKSNQVQNRLYNIKCFK